MSRFVSRAIIRSCRAIHTWPRDSIDPDQTGAHLYESRDARFSCVVRAGVSEGPCVNLLRPEPAGGAPAPRPSSSLDQEFIRKFQRGFHKPVLPYLCEKGAWTFC